MLLRTRGARNAVRGPGILEIRGFAEVLARINVMIPGRHHHVVAMVTRQHPVDLPGNRSSSSHSECPSLAEIALHIDHNQDTAHV